MTSEELDRLDALANAATAGPWQTNEGTRWTVSKRPGSGLTDAGTFFVVSMAPEDAADATFIAAARDAVPALVAEVRRLKEANDSAFQRGFESGAAQLSRSLKETGKL